MVTILPIDVDTDLVREGLGYALAARIREAVKQIDQQAMELQEAGVLDRRTWDAAFDALARLRETMEPVLEYAKAFSDQWPEGDDEATTRATTRR